jgi:uncharacterized membrane protein YjjB (DUF3815 family)
MNAGIQLLAALAGSAGFALLFNARGEKLLWASLGGLLSWGVYLLFGFVYESDPARYFIAALALTVYAEIMARLHKAPVTVFLVAGTIPLIPGGSLYQTMRCAVAAQWMPALQTGLTTLLLAVAIAAGILACMVLWHIGELAQQRLARRNSASR